LKIENPTNGTHSKIGQNHYENRSSLERPNQIANITFGQNVSSIKTRTAQSINNQELIHNLYNGKYQTRSLSHIQSSYNNPKNKCNYEMTTSETINTNGRP
jgi:hypothetical protein